MVDQETVAGHLPVPAARALGVVAHARAVLHQEELGERLRRRRSGHDDVRTRARTARRQHPRARHPADGRGREPAQQPFREAVVVAAVAVHHVCPAETSGRSVEVGQPQGVTRLVHDDVLVVDAVGRACRVVDQRIVAGNVDALRLPRVPVGAYAVERELAVVLEPPRCVRPPERPPARVGPRPAHDEVVDVAVVVVVELREVDHGVERPERLGDDGLAPRPCQGDLASRSSVVIPAQRVAGDVQKSVRRPLVVVAETLVWEFGGVRTVAEELVVDGHRMVLALPVGEVKEEREDLDIASRRESAEGPRNEPRRVGDAQPEHVQPVLEVGDEGGVDALDVGGHRGGRRFGGERRRPAGRHDDRRSETDGQARTCGKRKRPRSGRARDMVTPHHSDVVRGPSVRPARRER